MISILGRLKKQMRMIFDQASNDYTPNLSITVDPHELCLHLAELLQLPVADVEYFYTTYQAFHEQHQYQQHFGERKTLCFEEAFILFALIHRLQPSTIIEIGTQYGKSTRRILDMRSLANSNAPVICFDVTNQVEYFTSEEASLLLKDVTNTVRQDIFEQYQGGLIYLDAHPYHLLKNVIQAVLDYPQWLIAIHDCGKGLCNPKMPLRKDDLNITSATGHWERHVLAEVFGIANPLSPQLDDYTRLTHHLKIFDTPHGLAVIMPTQMITHPDKTAESVS